MADLILAIGTPHASLINTPASEWDRLRVKDEHDKRMDYQELLKKAPPWIDREITPERMQEKWDACVRGAEALGEILREKNPDILLVVGDDQYEVFRDDNMPTFAIFNGSEMPLVKRKNWWNPDKEDSESRSALPGEPDLANHLINFLCADGFDITRTNRIDPQTGLGHAFAIPYARYLPDREVAMVPFMVNTYFPPNTPTPRRCYNLGKSLRRAINAWESDKTVALVASGGLSHQIIDEEIDRWTLDALVEKDAQTLCSLPVDRLTRGTSEIRNWIIVGGAVEDMDMTLIDYITGYRSPAATGCAGAFAYWTQK